MATHSSIPAWKLPWTEEPGGLQTMRSQRVRQDREHTPHTTHTHTHTHRGRICNSKLSKVNAPRKEKSGAYSQKETCLKFSQAEWNVKAALVRSCRKEGKTHGNDVQISRL